MYSRAFAGFGTARNVSSAARSATLLFAVNPRSGLAAGALAEAGGACATGVAVRRSTAAKTHAGTRILPETISRANSRQSTCEAERRRRACAEREGRAFCAGRAAHARR